MQTTKMMTCDPGKGVSKPTIFISFRTAADIWGFGLYLDVNQQDKDGILWGGGRSPCRAGVRNRQKE